MPLKFQIRLAIVLGVLSLATGVLGHLALTDIYHAETDLRLEWAMLRLFALIFLLFIGYTLMTLRNVLRAL
jgi:hypothetical protein